MMSESNQRESSLPKNQPKQCRICLDTDNPVDIISPCLCSGGSAYVHRKCLNDWRAENRHGRGFQYCEVCQFEYIIEPVVIDQKAERERLIKYNFFVIRDSTAIILLVQAVIIGFSFLLKAIDKDGNLIKRHFPTSMKPFTVYYLSSFIVLLAIVGFITLIIMICADCYYGSSSRSSCSNSSSNGLFTGVVATVVICALIGLVVGIVVGVIVLRKIMKHHAQKLWLRQEAEKFIVKDFQGQREELDKYKKPATRAQ